MKISAQNISKTFGSFAALKNVSFEAQSGELLAILGPSGSGKTSLLRIIGGLEAPDQGAVLFDGKSSRERKASGQQVGFVFQHYALFRHMTVFENVAFGLRVRPRRQRLARPVIKAKVEELLHLVQLDRMAERHPAQLSGGQRQRVALARALAIEPQILLLDEPFGALDAKVRRELRRWLRQLHDQLHITSIFVTHDQEEALELADRVVIMREGQIEQIGATEEVYSHPASPFVYDFLGNVNFFHARIQDGRAYIGTVAVDLPQEKTFGETAKVYVRPHLIDIKRQANGDSGLRGVVTHISPNGPRMKVEVNCDEGGAMQVDLSVERFQELSLEKGAEVFLVLQKTDVFAGENI